MTPRNRRLPEAERPIDSADDREGLATREAQPIAQGRHAGWWVAARSVLGGGLVLALSTTVAWQARRHLLSSPRFAVDDVVVSGTHHRSEAEVAEEAGVTRGMNVFALDLERAREKLLADPWIERATIGRRLPGRVSIAVTEREAAAVVALPEPYLVARDGTIFKRFDLGDPGDLPVVTGITADAVAADRDGAKAQIATALELAGDYEHGPLAARAPLQEVHVSNGGELTLVVGKDGVGIALGLPPFRRKLEEAARIFTELDHRGARPSVVMLDDEARPDRVVVRTRL